MARTDTRRQLVSLVFSAISTPRRIRLSDPTFQQPQQWEYICCNFRGDPGQRVFLGLNGATASSTVSTTASLTGALLTSKQVIGIMTQYLPFEIWTKATSLSIQGT